MAYQIFAVIRVGSLEQELSIYEIGGKKEFRRIDRIINRLPVGRETFELGRISYESMEQLFDVLKGFTEIMKTYRVNAYKAYATSAFREAENSKIVTDRIKVRTGISIDVVSNSEQRFINYKAIAVKPDISFNEIIKDGAAIIDSSYGGIQISLFDNDKLVSTENLPLASAKIAETVESLPITRSLMVEEIKEVIDAELTSYKRLYLKNNTINTLVGIGESTDYLFRGKSPVNEGVISVDADQALKQCEEFIAMGSSGIEEKLQINRSLSDALLVSSVIYKRLIERFGAKKVIFPGSGFCDGAAAEYAEKNKLVKFKHDFDEDIVAASKNMAKRYKCDTEHSRLVEEYALKIFDGMKKIGGFTKRDRLILRIAAMLHSCGKFINIKNSAWCGYNIILSTEIIGLSHREREITASVVMYNTTEFDYSMTDNDEDLIRTAKLTAILRIANALDRGHKNKLENLKVTINEKEKKFIISASSKEDMTLERMEVDGKAGFFEEIFGYKPVFKHKKTL